MMKKFFKVILKPALFLGTGLLLVWLITKDLTDEQWQSIKDAFRRANYWILIPALLLGILSHWIRAVRWKLLFEPMGFRPRNSLMFAAIMIGYLTNLVVIRLGEIARCGVLARNEGIPMEKALGTVLAERIVDAVSVLIIILLSILTQSSEVKTFFYDNVLSRLEDGFHPENLWTNVLILFLVLIFLAVLAYLFRKSKWFGKIKKLLWGIKEGLLTAIRLKRKFLFLVLTVAMWASYLFMMYVGFFAFRPTSHLGLREALSVLSAGSIGMILTQGGLGAYQLLVSKTLGVYGISQVYGFAFSWLSWILQTGIILSLGSAAFLFISILKRRKSA